MSVMDEVQQIIDYKRGIGILVSADKDPQMRCYIIRTFEMRASNEIVPWELTCFYNLYILSMAEFDLLRTLSGSSYKKL